MQSKKSDVIDDPQIPYYTEVEKFTNMSKAGSRIGGNYVHNWKVAIAAELVQFDGILIRDGVLGGSNSAIYRRFQKNSCCYFKEIDNVMTATRYSQLKLSLKLCHNGSAPKRGDEVSDPAYCI